MRVHDQLAEGSLPSLAEIPSGDQSIAASRTQGLAYQLTNLLPDTAVASEPFELEPFELEAVVITADNARTDMFRRWEGGQ